MKLQLEKREPESFGRMLYEGRLRNGSGGRPLSVTKAAVKVFDVSPFQFGKWEKGEAPVIFKEGDDLLEKFAKFTGRSKLEILRVLGFLGEGDLLGGWDSNPQPTDYEVAVNRQSGTKRHLAVVVP